MACSLEGLSKIQIDYWRTILPQWLASENRADKGRELAGYLEKIEHACTAGTFNYLADMHADDAEETTSESTGNSGNDWRRRTTKTASWKLKAWTIARMRRNDLRNPDKDLPQEQIDLLISQTDLNRRKAAALEKGGLGAGLLLAEDIIGPDAPPAVRVYMAQRLLEQNLAAAGTGKCLTDAVSDDDADRFLAKREE
jgi:hypothetical protein